MWVKDPLLKNKVDSFLGTSKADLCPTDTPGMLKHQDYHGYWSTPQKNEALLKNRNKKESK